MTKVVPDSMMELPDARHSIWAVSPRILLNISAFESEYSKVNVSERGTDVPEKNGGLPFGGTSSYDSVCDPIEEPSANSS